MVKKVLEKMAILDSSPNSFSQQGTAAFLSTNAISSELTVSVREEITERVFEFVRAQKTSIWMFFHEARLHVELSRMVDNQPVTKKRKSSQKGPGLGAKTLIYNEYVEVEYTPARGRRNKRRSAAATVIIGLVMKIETIVITMTMIVTLISVALTMKTHFTPGTMTKVITAHQWQLLLSSSIYLVIRVDLLR